MVAVAFLPKHASKEAFKISCVTNSSLSRIALPTAKALGASPTMLAQFETMLARKLSSCFGSTKDIVCAHKLMPRPLSPAFLRSENTSLPSATSSGISIISSGRFSEKSTLGLTGVNIWLKNGSVSQKNFGKSSVGKVMPMCDAPRIGHAAIGGRSRDPQLTSTFDCEMGPEQAMLALPYPSESTSQLAPTVGLLSTRCVAVPENLIKPKGWKGSTIDCKPDSRVPSTSAEQGGVLNCSITSDSSTAPWVSNGSIGSLPKSSTEPSWDKSSSVNVVTTSWDTPGLSSTVEGIVAPESNVAGPIGPEFSTPPDVDLSSLSRPTPPIVIWKRKTKAM